MHHGRVGNHAMAENNIEKEQLKPKRRTTVSHVADKPMKVKTAIPEVQVFNITNIFVIICELIKFKEPFAFYIYL